MKRHGFLSLWLLLSLSAVLAASGAFLYAASHTVRAETAALHGLRAQYAAESGAVWALETVKRNGISAKTVSFSLDENANCKVKISQTVSKTGEITLNIQTRGEDMVSGALRYVQLTADAKETDGAYAVTVRDVGNKKW